VPPHRTVHRLRLDPVVVDHAVELVLQVASLQITLVCSLVPGLYYI
jgi:hypothetical protein